MDSEKRGETLTRAKRAAPAFARTNAGCLTCRRRRKKCPEEYSDAGVCQRCEASGHVCERDVATSSRRRSASATPRPPSQPAASAPNHLIDFSQALAPQPPYLPHHTPPPTIHPTPPICALPTPFAPLPNPNPPPNPYGFLGPVNDPPLFPEAAFSPTLSSFFNSLQPAVDPLAFDWRGPPSLGQASGSPMGSLGSIGGETWRASPSQQSLETSTTDEARDEAKAVPIYAALSDAFLTSLPQPVRLIVKRRIMDVAFSSELSKSASIALCLLYQARALPDGDEARQRLVQQSGAYFDKAAALIPTSALPLEAQMLATLDLLLHALESNGAAAGYSVLLLLDHWVVSSLGRPRLDLTTLEGLNTILFRSIAHIDVTRCVFLGARSTIFDLVGVPGSSPLPSFTGEAISSEACEGSKGVPTGLLLCLAATCNLAVEEAVLEKGEFRRRAEEIERSIKGWTPVAITPRKLAGEMGLKLLDDLATHEMWRHAALIHLYQTLFHYGPLQPALRHALSQLLTFGSRHSASIMALDSPSLNATTTSQLEADHLPTCDAVQRAPCWFLAATVAVDGRDRAKCREALGLGRPARLAEANLAAAEKLWELSDAEGWPLRDWRTALASERVYVAFL